MKCSLGAAAITARANGERFVRGSLLVIGILLSAMGAMGQARPVHGAELEAAAPTQASQATPEQVVAGFHTALVHAMKANGYQARYDALAPAMTKSFDFATMTRIAVGPRWATLPSDQQTALIEAFRRFSVANYANQFESYSGERFETVGAAEPAPQGLIVPTVLQPADGKPIKVNYLLHRTATGWRIVDIYLEGTISQLAVRRSEFTSVLAQSGADGLAHLLDQKAKRLAMM